MLLETTPLKYKTLVGSCMQAWDSSLPIWASLYFLFIDKNWIWYEIFILGINFANLLVFSFLKESPKFLYEKKRYDDARKVFRFIAKINKKEIDFSNFKFDKELEEEA